MSDELYSSEEMAEHFGMSKSNMDARIRKAGLQPVVPSRPGVGGRPALYDESALIQIEEEEAIAIAKQRQIERLHVDKLTDSERQLTVRKTFEALSTRDKLKFALEAQVAALQALADTEDELVEAKRVVTGLQNKVKVYRDRAIQLLPHEVSRVNAGGFGSYREELQAEMDYLDAAAEKAASCS